MLCTSSGDDEAKSCFIVLRNPGTGNISQSAGSKPNGLWLGQPPAGLKWSRRAQRCASASAVENIHNWFILGGVDISSTTVYAGTRQA